MASNDNYVLIIGSSNMDLNIYSKRFPIPGETVTGGIFTQSFGGKGANQAVASSRSGSKTVFIGRVGQDPFGSQMLENLTNEGIDTTRVIVDPEHASGVAVILIDSNGQNMISVAPGANAEITPEDIQNIKDIIENATVIVVQMEIPMDVIRDIFNITSKKNVITILNPAPFKEIPLKLLKQIDIITPNENELSQLHSSLGLKELQKNDQDYILNLINDLHGQGVNTIIVTLGNKGCFVSNKDKEEQIHVPAIKVSAIDTVGAGDCFNGVLASRLCEGYELLIATRYANVAASIAVTKTGAQSSMPFFAEIEKRFNQYYII
ncbi:MAG: ribokinase [Candidatus Heimdallarchaeota archaeon]|nr:MAG: ribokinase [Candidatus Heimdallarchaeota archaeon]